MSVEPLDRPRLIESVRPLEPMILAAEATIEDERRMPAEITDALYETGMYRAFLPAELGGLDVHPLEWLEAVEELSRMNGSVGWLCMLHTGSTWAQPEAMREILKTERWITAGNVGRASGIARKVEGGYMVTGKWPFCSGSPEATYLYGRSVLHGEDGEPLTSPRDGLPYYISGYIPAKDVQVHNNWNGLGLRGTGSGDITVEEVFMPREMVNESGIWTHHYASPLMRANFNLAAHAAHALGLAVAALEEFKKTTLMRARRGSFRQARLGKEQTNYIAVGKADAKIRSARLFMQDVIARAYENAKTQTHIDYELRVLMHEVNVHVVSEARQVVELMFKEIGAVGTVKGLRMERIFRDMMTASQHAIVIESSYDRAGQYWLTKDQEEGPILDVEFGYVRPPHPQNSHLFDK
ncbi:acyl-CoA dehydrogenase family protein [Leucobacter rhizosphaerae]|uniref:Acyl-CoA dehydrogenase family protein n=1 Tax=Leucobacter rhizosphaerae TaxID=2932245 RepID=A0ABY4FTD5_9MICO|nr:acyl-CoA dehydrogenase family protein [Leucobacter rhizosphaerae]UOQ59568.1 acyl-CoA dehydrogenase family protein [Leucobacter rhizosphaerae]